MEPKHENLKRLLPHGSLSAIAKKLGISASAVSQSIKEGRPGSKAVQEAVRIAEESGALATAQKLASLPSAA
jgi:predicted transcriptional regulator